MDEKPFRHEEYMAMAEELRRVTAENKKLNEAKVKKSPWCYRHWHLLFGFGCAALFIGVFVWAFHEDNLDIVEQNSEDNICYSGVNTPYKKDPWNETSKPWHIWREHVGRKYYWEEMIEPSFTTWKEGDDFYNKWKLPYCGEKYGKDWRSKRLIRHVK